MPTVKQQIDVRAPAQEASRQWDQFVKWVLVGNYRFVCDEFSCERAVEAGVVTFTESEDRDTRVCVTFDYEDESPNRMSKERMINARLLQDLARFKEFAETGTDPSAVHSRENAATRTDETGQSRFVE